MTKTTLALAAALLAGTTLTSAANAGGVRVGFGFPLGSFIAHSNQSYSGEGYGSGRNCHKPRYAARRQYEAAAAPVRKIKRAPKAAVAYKVSKPEVQTAKLEDKLITNDETTTEIAKTPASDVSGTQSTASTTRRPLQCSTRKLTKPPPRQRRRWRRSRHPRSRRSPRSRRPRRAERPNRRRSRYLPPSAYAAGSRLPSPAWSTCPASKVNRLTPRQTAASALGNVSPNSYRP